MKIPPYSSISLLVSPHPEGAAVSWAGSACRECSGSVELASLCSLQCLWYRALVFPASNIIPVSSHCWAHTQSQPNFLPRAEPICRSVCAGLKHTEVIFSVKCPYELNLSQMCPLELWGSSGALFSVRSCLYSLCVHSVLLMVSDENLIDNSKFHLHCTL